MNGRNVLLTLAWCGFAIVLGACGDSPTRPGPVRYMLGIRRIDLNWPDYDIR